MYDRHTKIQRAEALALYREQLERRVRGGEDKGGRESGGGKPAPPDVHTPEVLQVRCFALYAHALAERRDVGGVA